MIIRTTTRFNIQQFYVLLTHCTYVFRRVSKKVLLASSWLSVRPPAWKNSPSTAQIFMKFDIWVFFEILSRKFYFQYNLTRITGTLHEDVSTFMIVSRRILLRMSKVSHKFYVYGSVHRISILIIVQWDATQSSVFIILQVHLHVSGVNRTHHQEYIKM